MMIVYINIFRDFEKLKRAIMSSNKKPLQSNNVNLKDCSKKNSNAKVVEKRKVNNSDLEVTSNNGPVDLSSLNRETVKNLKEHKIYKDIT